MVDVVSSVMSCIDGIARIVSFIQTTYDDSQYARTVKTELIVLLTKFERLTSTYDCVKSSFAANRALFSSDIVASFYKLYIAESLQTIKDLQNQISSLATDHGADRQFDDKRFAFQKVRHCLQSFSNVRRAQQINDTITLIKENIDKLLLDARSLIDELENRHLLAGQHSVADAETDVFKADFLTIPHENNVFIHDADNVNNSLVRRVKSFLLGQSPNRAQSNIVAVTGMAGIGKTSLLVNICHQLDIKSNFSDGIYFLTVGKDATKTDFVEKLCRILSSSGGERKSRAIEQNGKFESAIDTTTKWFHGKRVLFVFDDLWASAESTTGFLNSILHLSLCSRSAYFLTSTRSEHIAAEAALSVNIKPFVQRNTSRRIFQEYAGLSSASLQAQSLTEAINDILNQCGGLPLTLAIAGRAVKRLLSGGLNTEAALQNYVLQLKTDRGLITRERFRENQSVFEAAEMSINIAEEWGTNMDLRTIDDHPLSCSSLFTSLCVFQRQAQIDITVISKLWHHVQSNLVVRIIQHFFELNLVSIQQSNAPEQMSVSIHDLLLDYCRYKARRENQYADIHRNFVDNFIMQEDSIEPSLGYVNVGSWNEGLLTECIRPWWDVRSPVNTSSAEYINSHIAWHLVEGQQITEIVSLLSDVRWTKNRLFLGGYESISSDFNTLFNSLSTAEQHPELQAILTDLKTICSVIREAWPFISREQTELAPQLISRLLDLEDSSWVVKRFIESAHLIAEGLWLRPMQRCWSEPDDRKPTLIPLAKNVLDISIFWKQDKALFVTDSQLGSINLWTKEASLAYTNNDSAIGLTCVAFNESNDTAIVGRSDGQINILECTNNYKSRVLFRAYMEKVCSLCINSESDKLITSSFSGNVLVWCLATRELISDKEPNGRRNGTTTLHESSNMVCYLNEEGSISMMNLINSESRTFSISGIARIACLDLHSDSNTLVVGCEDGNIHLINSLTECLTRSFHHGAELYNIEISGNGEFVASTGSDCSVNVFDMNGNNSFSIGSCSRIPNLSVYINDDGRNFITLSSSALRIWDTSVHAPRGSIGQWERPEIKNVRIDSGGLEAVSTSVDGSCYLWDVRHRINRSIAKVDNSQKDQERINMEYKLTCAFGIIQVIGSEDRYIQIKHFDGENRAELLSECMVTVPSPITAIDISQPVLEETESGVKVKQAPIVVSGHTSGQVLFHEVQL